MERTTSSGLLLQKLTQPHPHISLICPRPQLLSTCLIKCPHLAPSPSNPRSFRPATRWDSDAETDNKYPGEKRRWWSDEDLPDSDSDAAVESGGLAWDEVIDTLWVIKVFKSFGWFLLFIIPSFNLFTDPKAFILMVSAVTLVQSLVFTSEKLLSRTEKRPRRNAKVKTRTSGSNNETKNQTRVVANEDSIKRSNFGGWDDLDESGYVQSRPSRSRERPMKKAKMSRKKRRDTPLLLRLLISVFPILNSWTKMF